MQNIKLSTKKVGFHTKAFATIHKPAVRSKKNVPHQKICRQMQVKYLAVRNINAYIY